MTKGITTSGFEFEVTTDKLTNDYEFVEQLAELDDNPLVLPKVLLKVLGKDQSAALKEHVRNEEGIVPNDLIIKEIEDIFTIAGETTKNS